MNKNNIINFPIPINKQIDDLIARGQRNIDNYERDVKKLNWFAAGFTTGALLIVVVFSCVYYFLGVK